MHPASPCVRTRFCLCPDPELVVITPVGFGTQLVGLRPALAAVGYRLAHAYGSDRELWLKEGCRPLEPAN